MNPKLLIIREDKYINTTADIILHIYHVLYVYEFTGSNLIILDEEEIEKEMCNYYDSQESIIVVH